MNYEKKLGINMELLYHIKIVEEILDYDHSVSLMYQIWYDGYNNSRMIINDKMLIYSGAAEYILNENPNEKQLNLIIKSIKSIFNYLDNKMIMNKLTDSENDDKEIIEYNLELLKYPKSALENIEMQQRCWAC